MTMQNTYEEVKQLFNDYMEEHGYRKTSERFTILKEVYSRDDHFDAEMLYLQIKNKNYNISRSTVYNTMHLLLDSGLVIKHQFGNNVSKFEKSYGYRQHDHLVCLNCNEVYEFCDPRLHNIQEMIGRLLKFKIDHHALTLYGTPLIDKEGNCERCAKNIS